jgi:FkbM family methyltransferase
VSLQGALRALRVTVSGDTRRPLAQDFWQPLVGGRALELGGPSAGFGSAGVLPVYPRLARIDGVQPAAVTNWHQLDPEEGNQIDGRRRGDLYIADDIDLTMFPDDAYDVVLSAHVIEHIANPLRALAAWRRVTRPDGHLLLVVPHMAATFDHRRELTPVSHMVSDLREETAETDLTHLEEFLLLHDADRNVRGQDDPVFVAELRDNARTRLLHHHTFTAASLVELLDYAGLQVTALQSRLPHDIFLLGHWLPDGARPSNEGVLQRVRRSPFRVDREAAKRARGDSPELGGANRLHASGALPASIAAERLIDTTYGLLARSRWAVRAAVHGRGITTALVAKRMAPSTLPEQNGEYQLLSELRGGARVILDVGANVGDWSAVALERWPELERVVCFEPGVAASERLERRFSEDPRVTVVRHPLTDRAGTLTFWEEPDGGTMSSAVAGYGSAGAVARTLEATTLDAELDRLELAHVDMLKIDAEGLDLNVLRGASDALESGRIDVVQFEYSDAWQEVGGTLREAYSLLEESGYRVLMVTPKGLRVLPLGATSELFVYANFVALAPGRQAPFEHVPTSW